VDWDALKRWREFLGEEYDEFPVTFERALPIERDESLVKGYLARAGYTGLRQGTITMVVPGEIVK
jgi:hypothetical protein